MARLAGTVVPLRPDAADVGDAYRGRTFNDIEGSGGSSSANSVSEVAAAATEATAAPLAPPTPVSCSQPSLSPDTQPTPASQSDWVIDAMAKIGEPTRPGLPRAMKPSATAVAVLVGRPMNQVLLGAQAMRNGAPPAQAMRLDPPPLPVLPVLPVVPVVPQPAAAAAPLVSHPHAGHAASPAPANEAENGPENEPTQVASTPAVTHPDRHCTAVETALTSQTLDAQVAPQHPPRWRRIDLHDALLTLWFNLRRALGITGLIGAALTASGLTLLMAVAPALDEAARDRMAQVAATREQRASVAADKLNAPSGAQVVAQFIDSFPPVTTQVDDLAFLVEQAQQAGVQLARAEYQMRNEPTLGLVRYQIALPVQARYATLRGFVAAVLNARPHAALEELAMERKEGDAIEARVRFSFVYRGGDGQ